MASVSRVGMRCTRQLLQSSQRSVLRPEHIRQSSPGFKRIAPFSTTSQKKILPPGPQVVHGGVNDPAPVPEPHPTHGSYHWIAERLVAVGLVPLTLAPFAAGSLNPTTDAILVAGLLVHSHMGFKAVIIDYIPEWEYPRAKKVFDWLLVLATTVVGVGLYEFETNDVGMTEAIKRIWRAGSANDATVKSVEGVAGSGLGFDGKMKNLKN